MSGRQVAVVCPTTLLARQHFTTFTERFHGWPSASPETRNAQALAWVREISFAFDEILDPRVKTRGFGMPP